MTDDLGDDNVTVAAYRLLKAEDRRTPCAPIRDLVAPEDVETAYAVQQVIIDAKCRRGARVVGRKIGLTSPAVQQQLGVAQPDFGVLLDNMGFSDGQELPATRLLQPKAEAEVAFELGADLDADHFGLEEVAAAVEVVFPALEIVDSRIANWDITFADTVADNASSGLFVLGQPHSPLEPAELQRLEMKMTVDGQVVSSGDGAACLGNPLNALLWLATTARDFGQPLKAGQIILSGALGPMYPLGAGQVVSANISQLGSVTTRLSPDPASEA